MESERQSAALSALVEALEGLIGGRIGLTEVSRRVSAARFALRQEQNALFLPFVGFDSETIAFPLGATRELWAYGALERSDREREATEQHYLPYALKAATPLLAWAHVHAS